MPFLSFVFLFFFSAFAHGSVNLQKIIPSFDQKLIALAKAKGIPGFAAVIVSQGKPVYTQCYGVTSLATQKPITPHTVFQLGSVSKTITSALFGVLFQKGLIAPQDKVSQYLPNFNYQPGVLTLHHLLTHTSGISRAGFNALVEAEKLKRDQIFERLGRSESATIPGTMYDYHNVAYGLIAPIIEAAIQQSYEDALRTYIFKPLNMHNASASYEGLMAQKNRAYPHQKTKSGGYTVCSQYRKGYYEIAPAGGVNASITDMAAFLASQMGAAPKTLTPQTLNMLHSPLIPAVDFFTRNPANRQKFKTSSYGMGWRVLDYRGTKILFHGGWVKGFSNIIAFLPSHQIGIVILQNAETSFHWIATMTLIDCILGIEGNHWGEKPGAPKIIKRKTSLVGRKAPLPSVKKPFKKVSQRSKGYHSSTNLGT